VPSLHARAKRALAEADARVITGVDRPILRQEQPPRKGMSLRSLSRRIVVQVDGDELIVFLPGTDYIATFYRATPSELLAKSHAGHEVGDAPMTCAEFQGRAWRAANNKARELGWIV
jgi:hypothetical protein